MIGQEKTVSVRDADTHTDLAARHLWIEGITTGPNAHRGYLKIGLDYQPGFLDDLIKVLVEERDRRDAALAEAKRVERCRERERLVQQVNKARVELARFDGNAW